ncbi:MAG TPA: glycosyltransferase, partial [Polyangiaceae bacterium]|nr:glycosyltransferase [Polyangiaceae bacterium]
YDSEQDDTLAALAAYGPCPFELVKVKNRGHGPLAAILSGFAAASASAVLVLPADDDYNASRVDAMVELMQAGADVVCANRFAREARVRDYPWLKALLVRTSAFLLHRLARLPSADPTNGFRLFSRRVIETLPVETADGFAYSLELLVKVHRLGWPIAELPADWYERKNGKSRFYIARWWRSYWRWFQYAFATTYLGPFGGAPKPRLRRQAQRATE